MYTVVAIFQTAFIYVRKQRYVIYLSSHSIIFPSFCF